MLNSEKPKMLDMYCGAGGAAMGYYRAGFEIVGIDIKPQPNYPFEFIRANALEYPLDGFDCYHASPPCQGYIYATKKYRNQGKEYPLLIDPTRERLIKTGKPYVIENPVGAPLFNPIRLCGVSFGLRVLRHRLFESNIGIMEPPHIKHEISVYKGTAEAVWTGGYNCGGFGNKELADYLKQEYKKNMRSRYYSVAGHGGQSPDYKLESWQDAMGIDWMNKAELVEAIPPDYTEYIGRWLIKYV